MALEVQCAVFVPFGLEDVRVEVCIDFGCGCNGCSIGNEGEWES